MYMSLEEIQKLPEPMRSVALSMFEENRRLQAEVTASKKVTDGLLNAKLKEADGARRSRVALLGKLSPKVMQDLGAMLEDPRMALSIGDNGGIIDPMAHTLSVLEKGLADLPRLMTTDVSALSVQRQPLDSEMLDDVRTTEIADNFSRMMGVPPTPPARAG